MKATGKRIWQVLTDPWEYSWRARHGSSFGILVLAGTFLSMYMYFFGYQEPFFNLNDRELFNAVINTILQAMLGMIVFLLWYLVDLGLARVFFKKYPDWRRSTKNLISDGMIPLIMCVMAWTYLRIVFKGSYLRWGLTWLPFVTIGTTFTWHYVIIYIIGSQIVKGEQSCEVRRWNYFFIAWIAVVVAGTICFFLGAPYAFGGTPFTFFEQVF
ncbi:hypothetical protein GF325_03880 [Candidatus Bathyarchaeota archaeon]|nr:hypothetical protein [Candidatus Bathyarchaeota archaeon]